MDSVKVSQTEDENQNTEKDNYELAEKNADTHVKEVVEPGDVVRVKDPYFRYRFGKQIVLVLIWICIGMSGEMTGPVLPDLMIRIGADYEEISRALAGKSIGMMIGSVLGGFINERFYHHVDLIMSLSLMLMAAACFILPWSVSVPMAAFAFGLNGFSEGIINTGGNTMVMDLWEERAASPMHSLHFGFGFGALLAPQIARPFLSPETEPDDSLNATTEDPENMEDLSRIEIPYSIVGTFVLGFSFVVLFFYIKGVPEGFPVRENNSRFRDMISPGSCAGGYSMFGFGLLTCLFIYFIQAVGGERAYGTFLFSFATYDDDGAVPIMSKDEASFLQSLFWLSFTTGRLLGIPLTRWLPLNAVIIVDICGTIITTIVLAILAYENVTILWVFTGFMGLFIAVVFPNGMSWANLRLDMNSVGVMILMVGGSCGGLIYQYFTGYLFEYRGPESMMYVMVGYGLFLLGSFVAMVVVAKACKPPQIIHEVENDEIEIVECKTSYPLPDYYITPL